MQAKISDREKPIFFVDDYRDFEPRTFAAADDDYVRTDEERERIRERIAKGNVAHVKEFMESIGQGPCS